MRRVQVTCATIAVFCLCGVSSAAGASNVWIGHRGDGSGDYGAGLKPPTGWNEYDFSIEKVGRDKRLVVQREKRQNIRWKLSLSQWSNSQPIVVGDRVYFLQEMPVAGDNVLRPGRDGALDELVVMGVFLHDAVLFVDPGKLKIFAGLEKIQQFF